MQSNGKLKQCVAKDDVQEEKKAALHGTRVKVVELEVHMTPSMGEIYQSIAELLDACIKELRKSNRIDTSELDIGAGLFKSFDDVVRRQLDSIWHTVSPRTKQVQILSPSRHIQSRKALAEES